jgi:hypothetical protein
MKKFALKATYQILFLGIISYFWIPFLYVYKNQSYQWEVFLNTGPYIALVIFLYLKLRKVAPERKNHFSQYLSIQKKLLPQSRKELKHAEEKLTIPNKEMTKDSMFVRTFSFCVGFLMLFMSITGWSLAFDLVFYTEEVQYEGKVLERKKNRGPIRCYLELRPAHGEDMTLGVSPELFDKAIEGQEIVITYQKGIFGFEKI